MSTRNKSDDFLPQYRKPRVDLYTVLLILALLAVLVAIFFLWAEMGLYDYKLKGRATAMAPPAVAELAVLPSGAPGTSAGAKQVIAHRRPPTPDPRPPAPNP